MGSKASVSRWNDKTAAVGGTDSTTTPMRRGEKVAWDWVQQAHDWVDHDTGEALSGYEPTITSRAPSA